MSQKKKIKYGMIGGGPGSFIGEFHRKAAELDGNIELVSGCFSSLPEKSYRAGRELFLNPKRVYGSYKEMVEKESQFTEDKKIDFVSIVTPNYLHFPIAKEFIKAGFNIVCDKPLAVSIFEADELCRLTREKNVVFAVTYNYTGYPLVKQARELIRKGVLGKIQKIIVEYSSDWLLRLIEIEGKSKDDIWRLDPKKVGNSLCIGDIGSHAENLVYYITELEIEKIYADLNTYVPSSVLEDEANILIRFKNGARGILSCSIVAAGETNNLNIKVCGNKASLQWNEVEPDHLVIRYPNKPEQVYYRDSDYLEPIVKHNIRLPAGHPEGYIEAFANIYNNIAKTILAKKESRKPGEFDIDFPTVKDGARGIYFVNRAIESGKKDNWVEMNFKSCC